MLPFIDQTFAVTYARFPFVVYMFRPLTQSVLLYLFPAIIMGIGFPMALQAWANHIHKVGRSTGKLLSDWDPPLPKEWPQQALEPLYEWNNTFNGQDADMMSRSPHV